MKSLKENKFCTICCSQLAFPVDIWYLLIYLITGFWEVYIFEHL